MSFVGSSMYCTKEVWKLGGCDALGKCNGVSCKRSTQSLTRLERLFSIWVRANLSRSEALTHTNELLERDEVSNIMERNCCQSIYKILHLCIRLYPRILHFLSMETDRSEQFALRGVIGLISKTLECAMEDYYT